MDSTIAINSAIREEMMSLITDLRSFVNQIQRPRLRDMLWVRGARQYCLELEQRALKARKSLKGKPQEFSASLERLAVNLRAFSRELSEHPNTKRMRMMYASLAQGYEEMLAQARQTRIAGCQRLSRAMHLKPTNYSRNIFHALMGVGAASLYHFALSRSQAMAILLSLFGLFALLEVTRRLSKRWNNFLVDNVFGIIARPFERHRTNSATYYLLALITILFLFPQPAVELAVLVLAFADPIASISGKRWGHRKLYRDKSWAGTAAFAVTAFATTALYLRLAVPAFTPPIWITISAVVAAAGAITELLSSYIDDNFSIPVMCAFVASLLI